MADHGGQIYKIVPQTGEITCVPPNPADLNGDGLVNGVDLAVLLGCWLAGCGDLNGDGTTDGSDLTVMTANWTG
jgi:hypothetical protein